MEEHEAESEAGDGAAWMATFADMMTLLLCFFILLLSFATMDIVKFRDAMGSVQEVLGVPSQREGVFEAVSTSPLQLDEFEAAGVGMDTELLQELQTVIAEEGLEAEISTEMSGRGVVVRINGRVLYQPGDALLRAEASAILTRIANVVKGTAHRVLVEGHTDNTPIATARYPSNWELSTARAIAGMRFLVENGVNASRVGVAGYADQRPLEANDSAEQRAANRRVEFVFIREFAEPGTEEDAQTEEAAEASAEETPQAAESGEAADEPSAVG